LYFFLLSIHVCLFFLLEMAAFYEEQAKVRAEEQVNKNKQTNMNRKQT